MATQVDRRLRVGIIGSGGIARAQHIPNYKRHPRAEVVAVADVDERAARLAADQFDIPNVYADYNELLARDDVDAVSVATPPAMHHDPVVAAAKAGKHILCEKPMALTVAQCDEMVGAARAAGVRLMVGYQPRFSASWQAVRRLIDEGAIGTPHGLNIISVGKAAHPRAWFFDPAIAGGGILMDWGTYTTYQMQYFLGPVESVYALGTTNLHEFTCRDGSVARDIQVEDTVAATLRFANGAFGVWYSTWASPGHDGHFEIDGSDGIISLGRGGAAVSVLSSRFEDPDYLRGWRALDIVDMPALELYRLRIYHFVDSLLDDTPFAVTGEDGRQAIAVTEALYTSMREGGPVTVSPPLTDGA